MPVVKAMFHRLAENKRGIVRPCSSEQWRPVFERNTKAIKMTWENEDENYPQAEAISQRGGGEGGAGSEEALRDCNELSVCEIDPMKLSW